MLRERYFQHLETFYANRSRLPVRWQEVSGSSEAIIHVTADELAAVDQEIMMILSRYRSRTQDEALRPEGALPIEVLLFAYPLRTEDG
jgi:hypothetical protein